MRPRLQPNLLPNCCGKATGPFVPREFRCHRLDSLFVDQLGVHADIIEDRGQLDQLPHSRNATGLAQILMTNNGLTYALGLLLGRAARLQQLER